MPQYRGTTEAYLGQRVHDFLLFDLDETGFRGYSGRMRRIALVLMLSAGPAAAGDRVVKTEAAKDDGFVLLRSGKDGDRYAYKAMHALIDVPKGFKRVPPKKNHDVAYQFAIRNEEERYEIRYQFNSLGETPQFAREAAECKAKNDKEPGSCVMADMSAPSESWLATVVFNLCEMDVPMRAFPADAVKKEFGADWGFTAPPVELDPRHDFNGAWKLGQASMISKKGAGKIYRILLADDLETMRRAGGKVFYLARFEGAEPPGLPK